MISKKLTPLGFVGIGLLAALQAGCNGNSASSKQAAITSLDSTPKGGPVGTSPATTAAALVEPAVVTVHTVGRPAYGPASPIQQFFGQQDQQQTTPRGAGSGVIISADGYIMTNDHVVADAVTVTVDVKDKPYTARVIGRDPVSDIAVVKIDTKGVKLTPAQLGDSSQVRVGDWAIAVGNPLDVGTTVTLGTISAVNRRGLVAEGHSLAGTIQTDAAINPGNSGGALADINGYVIGINEAIESPNGAYIGLGFAIPMNTARRVAAALIDKGKMVRPYLGVLYTPLSSLPDESFKQLGIPQSQKIGAIVVNVFPGSPAAQAGLQVHDLILNADGQPLSESVQLDDIVQKLKVGDILKLDVRRKGQPLSIAVHMRERPLDFGALSGRQQR